MIHGVSITPFDAAAILMVLAAALGFINIRFLHLPRSIGLTVMGAVASLLVVGVDRLLPGGNLSHDVARFDADQAPARLAETATALKHSAVEQVDSADRRTVLAAVRTILAGERTYAAWLRT